MLFRFRAAVQNRPKFVYKLRTARRCRATINLLKDAALRGARSHAAVSSQLRIPSLTPSQLNRKAHVLLPTERGFREKPRSEAAASGRPWDAAAVL